MDVDSVCLYLLLASGYLICFIYCSNLEKIQKCSLCIYYFLLRARDVKKIYIFSLKGVTPPTWDKMSQVPGTKCPRFGIIFQQYVEKKL